MLALTILSYPLTLRLMEDLNRDRWHNQSSKQSDALEEGLNNQIIIPEALVGWSEHLSWGG